MKACVVIFASMMILTVGCAVEPYTAELDADNEGPPAGDNQDDQEPTGTLSQTVLLTKANDCVSTAGTCHTTCLEQLDVEAIENLVRDCKSNIEACANNPGADVMTCMENGVAECMEAVEAQLDGIDFEALQDEIMQNQGTCSIDLSQCLDPILDSLPAGKQQCFEEAKSCFAGFENLHSQCDFQAMLNAIQCGEPEINTLVSCLGDALVNQDQAQARECLGQLLEDCGIQDLQNNSCVQELTNLASECGASLQACMP